MLNVERTTLSKNFLMADQLQYKYLACSIDYIWENKKAR